MRTYTYTPVSYDIRTKCRSFPCFHGFINPIIRPGIIYTYLRYTGVSFGCTREEPQKNFNSGSIRLYTQNIHLYTQNIHTHTHTCMHYTYIHTYIHTYLRYTGVSCSCTLEEPQKIFNSGSICVYTQNIHTHTHTCMHYTYIHIYIPEIYRRELWLYAQ